MTTALFINGIYDSVLSEILAAQDTRGGSIAYLQPHKSQVITMLRQGAPSLDSPIRLYISTTANLSNICYVADIVDWEDQRRLSPHRENEIKQHLREWQPDEVSLFEGIQKGATQAVNIITIQNLKRLDSLYSTSLLKKTSDDLPLKKRTRSGGWSEVYDLGDLLSLAIETREQSELDLVASVAASRVLSNSARAKRLADAVKVPKRIQIVSVGFRRNADVVVMVLLRANGTCEKCQDKAPFLRRSDGSPYLEVHHWVPLSHGGQDTVENAAALCPNCHRELHYG